jgi:hypothetical protein
MGIAERERLRLKALYSRMSDGELETIALDWADLTDLARNEIQDEASRRSLILDAEETPPVPDSLHNSDTLGDFPSGVVTIEMFDNLGEAVVVKGLLESAGIESFLIDGFNNPLTDQTTGPVAFPAFGCIQLGVKPEDVEAAKGFLAQPPPQNPEDKED